MKVTDVIAKLVHIPKAFHHCGDTSIEQLLRESGYFEAYGQIAEAGIREMLSGNPECVDEWLSYSEDKRCYPGWYFKREKEGQYVVGFMGDRGCDNTQEDYSDRISACACFIKHEIEHVLAETRNCPTQKFDSRDDARTER